MVYCSSTEFPIELFSTKIFQICDEEWPEMKDIVAGEPVSLLHDNCPCPQQSCFYGNTETTYPPSYDNYLQSNK